jgi:hypothetical protein
VVAGCAGALAAAALVPASAPAQAPEEAVIGGDPPNMFTTNVPYVAWRGEQLRAVKCDGALDGLEGQSADVLVETWSGPGRDPQLESGQTRFFTSSTGASCVRFDMVSSDAGLARVKLVVSDGAGDAVMKHQFLMVWLSMGPVAIDEIGANDSTGGPAGSQNEVGDPAGDGNFFAGDRPGRVRVNVTGSFPHPLGPGGQFTLPQDWPTIAGALANDNDPGNGDDTIRWDIHDDQGMGDQHVGGYCTTGPFGPLDDVDNCNGGGDLGPFSNDHGSGVSAAGPFDPARPGTLLSNGRVTADDAPMPAARVDVQIAPNSGGATDISGAGSLTKADKTVAYSRNGNGTGSAHNLYAPYYRQWIPATSSPLPEASGVDGPAQGNNFEGFLVDGLYDNWDPITLGSAVASDTSCNRFVDFRATLTGETPDDTPRTTPSGPQRVAIYTDEHGEGQVTYNPYAGGFYWDSLGALRNRNRGCDLQGIGVLGTSAINAVARYPYQPVDDAPRTSATIGKTVRNRFDKSLSFWPKGEGDANDNARIVVVHANDVDGSPFAGELVCFYVDSRADGVHGYTGQAGPLNAPFTVGGTPAVALPGADACRRLDANGNAAIEVFESTDATLNVIAEFAEEGILRDIDVTFDPPGSSGGPVPPATSTPSGPGTTTPTVAEIVRTVGAPASDRLVRSVKGSKVKRRVASARIVLRKGKRALYVRVNSTRRTERIVVRMGKRKLVRRVRTNRTVRVSGITVRKGTKVKVSLAR